MGSKQLQPYNNKENLRTAIKQTIDFMCFWEKKSRWMDDDRCRGEVRQPKRALIYLAGIWRDPGLRSIKNNMR